jgi:hypothetical protein
MGFGWDRQPSGCLCIELDVTGVVIEFLCSQRLELRFPVAKRSRDSLPPSLEGETQNASFARVVLWEAEGKNPTDLLHQHRYPEITSQLTIHAGRQRAN